MTSYETVLGDRLADCPPEVAGFHRRFGRFSGEITVERPVRPMLRFFGRLAGFPPEGTWPLTLTKTQTGETERWERAIGPRVMTSVQSARRGRLAETIGPVTVITDLMLSEGELTMKLQGVRVLGLPLPRWLGPVITTSETGGNGLYRFDVRVDLPILGARLVRYHGHLHIPA